MDVCFVNMPYAAIERPSLALGLLKAKLAQHSIRAGVVYGNLRFAQWLGLDVYKTLSTMGDCADLVGEWTFSGAAFPQFNPDNEAYLNGVFSGTFTEESFKSSLPGLDFKKAAWQIREQAGSFVDSLAEMILATEAPIVGCSSTVQQHCASLALLRRIREISPSIITILGGANCEGSMGLATLQSFSWIDFVVSGEADELLPVFIEMVLKYGREVEPGRLPYGVLYRDQDISDAVPRAVVNNLDALPVPDYSDYFNELKNSPLSTQIRPGLPVETSRGCWWGQGSQCTFCGLNGIGMKYRAKTASRALTEWNILRDRHELRNLQVADNILNKAYFKTLMPALAKENPPWFIFYETKAGLSHRQMELLAQAGVRWIQPGIESMHGRILSMLRKGTSPLRNIQSLCSALEFGIHVSWNFLVGIPGEEDEWYSEMVRWLPWIVHLQPPKNIVRIRFDRFSPYHRCQEEFGLSLAPASAYRYVYPVDAKRLSDLAYFFEDRGRVRGNFETPGLKALKDWIVKWHGLFWAKNPDSEVPVLYGFEDDHKIMIHDTRPCAEQSVSILGRLYQQALDLCKSPKTMEELSHCFRYEREVKVQEDELSDAVDQLIKKKFLLLMDGKLLNLVVRRPRSEIPKIRDYPGGFYEAIP